MGTSADNRGHFTYNAASGQLTFSGGPFEKSGWAGIFRRAKDGRSHEITLRTPAVLNTLGGRESPQLVFCLN